MNDLLVRINADKLVYFVPLGSVSMFSSHSSQVYRQQLADLVVNPETREVIKSRYF
jgi:hypothetical protein